MKQREVKMGATLKQAVEPTRHDQPAGMLAGIRHFAASGALLERAAALPELRQRPLDGEP